MPVDTPQVPTLINQLITSARSLLCSAEDSQTARSLDDLIDRIQRCKRYHLRQVPLERRPAGITDQPQLTTQFRRCGRCFVPVRGRCGAGGEG